MEGSLQISRSENPQSSLLAPLVNIRVPHELLIATNLESSLFYEYKKVNIQGEHKVFSLITNIYYKKTKWNTGYATVT